jgi:hypothetical protein
VAVRGGCPSCVVHGGTHKVAACQTAAMADLRLFVVIRGDLPLSENLFTVIAPASTLVAEWKKLVYAEKRNVLAAYDAADLMVRKVCLLCFLWRLIC